MPEYTLRNVDPELWKEFVNRAKDEGWPIRALMVALLEAYATRQFTPTAPPPRQLPEYGWLRAHYRELSSKDWSFPMEPIPVQWERLVQQVLTSQAAGSWQLVDRVPAENRGEILRWLQQTSNLPLRQVLTLRAIAHVGEGPGLQTNRRVFQYEVLGLPHGHQAWIANPTGAGWEILHAVDGKHQGTWSAPYSTKEEALSVLAETVQPDDDSGT